MTIFGREPSVLIGFIGSVLTTLAAMNLDFLSAGQAAALTAAISAVLIAVFTRPVAPALFTAAFVAVVALFAEYGLDLSPAVVGGVTSAILAGFALAGIRPQVSPTGDARPIG